MESIEMKIAKKAARNWGQQEPQNLEEAKEITWGSEISSIKGMISVLGLNPELQKQMIEDVYTRDSISEKVAKEIQTKFHRYGNNNNAIIEMLSVVHDEWVKSNSNNFLKEGRNKEFQFVPLQMLSWEEAKSDLLFLKPILEAAGIEVDKQAIKQQFEIVQKEFLIDNGIYSSESLIAKLKEGSKFYSALEGLETRNGGSIDELLKDDEISKKMAKQIESRIRIKSEKEMARDIIDSDNPQLDEIFWADTRVDNNTFSEEKCPRINGPISRREILLSKTIGMPYPRYITSGISDHNHDRYINEIRRPIDSEWDVVDKHKDTIKERIANIGEKFLAEEVKEVLLSDKDTIGIAFSIMGTGYIDKKKNIENKAQPIRKAMPKKMFDLGKRKGIGFPADIIHHQRGQGGGSTYKPFEVEFIYVDEKSPEWQQEEIKKRQKKLRNFQKKVLRNKDGKYDRKGIVLIPKYSTNTGYEYEPNEEGEVPKAWVSGFIEIEMTQRELAEAGILPDDFKWTPKTKVSSKSIIEAEQCLEKGLKTTEVGGIKEIFTKLLDKFKGKGEK